MMNSGLLDGTDVGRHRFFVFVSVMVFTVVVNLMWGCMCGRVCFH